METELDRLRISDGMDEEEMEDPMLVPLFFTHFWVQVHDLPPRFYSETGATWCQISVTEEEKISSFCPIQLRVDENLLELGWDISLRAPLARRAVVTKNVWLRNSCIETGGSDALNSINRVLGVNLDEKLMRFSVILDSEEKRGERLQAYQAILLVTTKGQKAEVEVHLRRFSKNHVDVAIWGANDDKKWKMTGFYGSLESRNRNESWHLLQDLGKDQSLSWLVCGDFNEIIYSYENKEGALCNEKRIEEFQQMLSDCQLEDLGFEGPWFTWEQGILHITTLGKN
ncbi:hypothetical protein Gotri_015986 [Gossypium trilobum]|uniref:Reverse transcriptase n=1 Tax=Gossypium trilobum TaxID=34281 RepID=A0A7J9E365_9ROSI|nr:hypothetical protein [Gossypium trilobum]